jgi:HJR/Mrr/RecB family endonuclease
MGYEAHKTKDSGDQGADVIANKFGQKTAVQTKRWDNKVNNKAIQEITAAIKYYNADEGIVITNNTFTISAIELAKSNDIKLIDREKLGELIKKHPIIKKEFD